jgi:hypothetical protein
MKCDIYSQAFATIAAAPSSSGEAGCFRNSGQEYINYEFFALDTNGKQIRVLVGKSPPTLTLAPGK